MIARNLTLLFVIMLGLSLVPTARAEQYVVQTPAGPKVVHTRVAPVVMHRVLPPFYGRHIYQGRAR